MSGINRSIKLRNEVYSWAKLELTGQKVFNIEAQIEILINNHGIKHTLKGKSFKDRTLIEKNEAMIMSVKYLKYFLETSEYDGFEKDKKGRDNILGFHVFNNTYNYKNVKYKVKILVKETRQKTYFYDQALIYKT